MKRFLRLTSAAMLGFLCCGETLRSQPTAPLELVETIPLPSVQGRIDHFAYDAAGERLFVCALGNDSLEVVDLRRHARVHSISGLGAPQGVGYAAEFNRLFVANDKGGICDIYDGKSLRKLGEINLGNDADNVRYDGLSKRIYVGFGSGGIAIINAQDGKQTGSIKLAGHPEAFQLEQDGKRIFVNVPKAGHVAVIDRDKGEVITTWKMSVASANFPMALDEVNHRLFVGCRNPSKLVVFNTDSGEVVTSVGISSDVDDVFYDSKRHHLYAICGAGKIDILDQVDANSYKALAKIDTASGARTGLFVPQLGTLFVAVPHRGSEEAEIRAYHVK